MERTKSSRRPCSNRLSISSSMQSSSGQSSPRVHLRRSMDYDESIFSSVFQGIHSSGDTSPRLSSLSQSSNANEFGFFPRASSSNSQRNTYGSSGDARMSPIGEYKENAMSPISISPMNKPPMWMSPNALPCKTLPDGIKVVTLDDVETLWNLRTREIKFIDCRYPYEHEVGRMINATNVYTSTLLQEHLPVETDMPRDNRVIIFYCEFSGDRAPKLLRELMRNDKMSSNTHYIYPDVYLLSGGFEAAFKMNSFLCGGCYREMKDRSYADQMRSYAKEAMSSHHHHSRSSSVSPVRSPIYAQTIISSQQMQED